MTDPEVYRQQYVAVINDLIINVYYSTLTQKWVSEILSFRNSLPASVLARAKQIVRGSWLSAIMAEAQSFREAVKVALEPIVGAVEDISVKTREPWLPVTVEYKAREQCGALNFTPAGMGP